MILQILRFKKCMFKIQGNNYMSTGEKERISNELFRHSTRLGDVFDDYFNTIFR